MKSLKNVHLTAAVWAALALTTTAAASEPLPPKEIESGSGITTQISGFIRSETAISTGSANGFNQSGNRFNGVPVGRTSAPPFGPGGTPLIVNDVVTRDVGQNEHSDLNMQQFRAQLDTTTHLSSDWSVIAKVRAIVDPGWYDEYSPGKANSHAVGSLYQDPNYFKYQVEHESRPNPLEWTGSNYMLDLPALFLEYNHGPLDIRIGNQQIAWGQAIFFRVLDVPDGLDFRRHSILDYAAEEFSDKRVPALGIRASYQFGNGWLLDGYVQKFQPSIYGNPNTSYNPIPSQFTVHDAYAQFDDKVDFGFRAKGDIGGLGVQGIYAHRYNPEGVYRWTASGVNRDIPGVPGSGQLLACTPFEVDPTGVWSADEWFYYAAQSRLSGIGGLNAAVRDFNACAAPLGAFQAPNMQLAQIELNTFFGLAGGLATGVSAGGLRGHLQRWYKAEDNIGGGLSYTFEGAPGSITDQLIMNWEVLYTPNRWFTSPDLGEGFLKKKEWTSVLALEKYQNVFGSLPATYLVAQFMYKSQSDLFGRYLGGFGGSVDKSAPGVSGGFKAFAFALQQPFPNLIWRADLAILYDLKGGTLIQPGIRWKPNGQFTAELFYNYINANIGGNPNKNMFGGSDYADELGIRLGYQF